MTYLLLLVVTLLIIFSVAALIFLLLSVRDSIFLLDFFGCVIATIVLLVSTLILFNNITGINLLTTILNSVGVEPLVL
jgi:hypothetical protein